VPTTTYTYDANGNVTQAGGWSYVWDYLNRMLASGYNNSTTTYGYDATGARVLQVSTTSTAYYPSKFFSLASTTNGGTSWATSTNYIWLGDTLLATFDQKLYNGTATSSAITRYVHPDHLGSTNVVTDASGSVTQLLDYYPYGATRVSSTTFPTNEKRQYIGQFADAQTSLSYLNARYYDGQRGQFLSQDPVFLALGNTSQVQQITDAPQASFLSDPQQANSYSYSSNNPVVKKDPEGKWSLFIIGAGISAYGTYFNDVYQNVQNPIFVNNPNLNPYLDNLSTPTTYVSQEMINGVTTAFLAERRVFAGATSFSSSLAQDYTNGKPLNYLNASIAATAAVVTGSFVKAPAGATADLSTRAIVAAGFISNTITTIATNPRQSSNTVKQIIYPTNASYATRDLFAKIFPSSTASQTTTQSKK
jgi:RHS repeat-associated protein